MPYLMVFHPLSLSGAWLTRMYCSPSAEAVVAAIIGIAAIPSQREPLDFRTHVFRPEFPIFEAGQAGLLGRNEEVGQIHCNRMHE